MPSNENVFIVGAGFSFNAGLPLAAGFTRDLLDTSRVKAGRLSEHLVRAMQIFVDDVFGNGTSVDAANWPHLEDLFTTIDLAANTGHNLGPKYSASDLRSVRRMLIIRLMRMLVNLMRARAKSPDKNYRKIREFFRDVKTEDASFLSMNWDCVIETLLVAPQGPHTIDYGCGALPASCQTSKIKYRPGPKPLKHINILKPHGSINWLYCDACGRLFWIDPKNVERISYLLYKPGDASLVHRMTSQSNKALKSAAECPGCESRALGTRFATFSYKKALEFPMHQSTWNKAEVLLRDATNWIFVGYSLPAADYEFKHLLKRVYLSRTHKPALHLITKAPAPDPTIPNFQRFFGSSALPDTNILNDGLDSAALTHLRTIGVLR